VPAGSFIMGSQEDPTEGPQHQVTFARPFAVGKFAVTFDEWDACVADGGCNGYRPPDKLWGRGRRPVINVSWNDAKAYVAWLSRKTGKNYRLLSEAEREYVTRAGTTTPYWWGTRISTDIANFDGSSIGGEYRKKTMPVDSFQPNPWGLYQVHGNVWDWTEDCWNANYNGAPTDGSARMSDDCTQHVLRGGSCNLSSGSLSSANRNWVTTDYRDYDVGFRVGMTLSGTNVSIVTTSITSDVGTTPPTQAPVLSLDPAERAWAAAKDTTNPAVLEAFIRRFGDSFYGDMARARLDELKKSQVAVGVFDQTRRSSVLTVAEERALKARDSFRECEQCPEMVVAPAGSFTMGSPASEPNRESNESPQHQVTFARPFAVGKFALTFDEWDTCVADGGCNGYRPSDEGWGRGRRPVINIDWNDTQAYVAWLSRKTGKSYRLLSESEREYVTRAGTITPFWWGSSISTSQANYNGNFTYSNGSKGEYQQRTMPVDSFQPNPWGLYQVHGNVREWTEDCYKDSYAGAPMDGSASTSGDCNRRVLRGGSWYGYPQFLRSASRSRNTTDSRDDNIGFRLGRTLSITP